jgi:hypothetical protein
MKLSFIIEAIDRATAPVRAINKRIDEVTEPVRRVRASFNSLLQESHLPRLAEQWRQVSDKFGGVTGALRNIGGAGLVAAAAVAAVWFPLKHVIDAGSKINDTAVMLGTTSREFQRVAYALSLDGSSAEDAGNSLRFLQKNAVEALTGNKEMAVWFRRAGMSASFLKQNLNDPIALLNKFADGMARPITAAQRLALAQALLNRGSMRTVQTLARGSEGLRNLGDEAERLGAIMSDETVSAMDEAGDSLTRMDRAVGGVFNRITAAALPAVEKISKLVIDWTIANRELIASKVSEFVDRLIANLPQIAETTMRIVGAVGTAIVVLDKIAQAMGGWDNVATALAFVLGAKLVVAIAQLGMALLAMMPTIVSFGVVLMATPIGWFLGAVALLAGAAYLVYKNWAPIKQFFVDLWATIKNAILQLDAATPDWVKRFTLPGAALAAAANAVRAPVAAASALPGGAAGAGGDVSGTIKIEIDQAGRARVAGMRSENPGVDFDVDSGVLFAAM